MEEVIYYSTLFDIYGSMLTERQKSVFESYYFENLTLDEIALFDGVSKSSVAKTLKQIKNALDEMESKLHFFKYMESLKKEFENEEDILIRISKYDNIVV